MYVIKINMKNKQKEWRPETKPLNFGDLTPYLTYDFYTLLINN
jgi:hypothetical protein